jgi:hypothetical protein
LIDDKRLFLKLWQTVIEYRVQILITVFATKTVIFLQCISVKKYAFDVYICINFLLKSDVATIVKMKNNESYGCSYPRHVGACAETAELQIGCRGFVSSPQLPDRP